MKHLRLKEYDIRPAFFDRFRHSVRQNRRAWGFRFMQASYRVLLAYCFLVRARSARRQLSLVAAIGLYYAYFHLLAGIMCIDPGISFRELPYFPLDEYRSSQYDYHDFVEKQGNKSGKLTHAKVKELAIKYERSGILTPSASLLFENLKTNRLDVNYRPLISG